MPMKAAGMFARGLADDGQLPQGAVNVIER